MRTARALTAVPTTLVLLALQVSYATAVTPSLGGDLSSAIKSLSQKCQARLAPIISSNFATCIDLTDLAAIMAVSSTQSVLPKLETWIDGIATESPCQTSDLSGVKQALDSSCSQGTDATNPTVVALNALVVNYSQLRDLLTIQQNNVTTSPYCVPDVLEQAQNGTGRVFSKDNLQKFLSGSSTQMVEMFQSLKPDVYCNTCGQGIVSKTIALLAHQNTTSGTQQSDDLKKNFVDKCGSQFSSNLDGSLPTGLAQPSSSADYRFTMASVTTLVFAAVLTLWIA